MSRRLITLLTLLVTFACLCNVNPAQALRSKPNKQKKNDEKIEREYNSRLDFGKFLSDMKSIPADDTDWSTSLRVGKGAVLYRNDDKDIVLIEPLQGFQEFVRTLVEKDREGYLHIVDNGYLQPMRNRTSVTIARLTKVTVGNKVYPAALVRVDGEAAFGWVSEGWIYQE